MAPKKLVDLVEDWERGQEGKGGRVLRLSAAGTCSRRLAYEYHGFPPSDEVPDWRGQARIGNLIHDYERSVIAKVLPLRDVERRVYLDVGLERIPGHIDGILALEDGHRLLEIKGHSTYSWRMNIGRGIIPERHMWQMQAYMAATGLQSAYYWAVNRDTGERWVAEVPFLPHWAGRIAQKFISVLSSTPENLPPRSYEAGRKLPYECSVCPFKTLCWGLDKTGEIAHPEVGGSNGDED